MTKQLHSHKVSVRFKYANVCSRALRRVTLNKEALVLAAAGMNAIAFAPRNWWNHIYRQINRIPQRGLQDRPEL